MKKILISILCVTLLSWALYAAESLSWVVNTNNGIMIASLDSWATPLIIDFEPQVKNPDIKYVWTVSNWEKIYSQNTTQIFSLPWEYSISLSITDLQWVTSSGSMTITARDEPNCELDYDGDNFNNCEDLCPLIEGGVLNKWCPLFEQKCQPDCSCDDGYTCNFSWDQNTCGANWVCLPKRPESSCYYNAEKNYLFWNAVCNSCPCVNKLEYNATIRMCDILFPAIVSADGKDIYKRWKFFEIK